jgi:hypothetical protein
MVDLPAPVWTLTAPCPICEQGTALVLVACPACSHVAVICDEEGSAFPSPRAIARDQTVDANAVGCPACSQGRLADFPTASADEIQAAGLRPGEYA